MIGRLPLSPAFAALLLAAAACSSGSPSSPEADPPESSAGASAAKPASPAPARAAPAQPARRASPANGERRCGWLVNPTPANWWLTDRDGQWILGSQGGDQAPGLDEMPDMTKAGWVETNGHYGYGCTCMTISHDPATRRVTRVAAAQPRPLRQCRADPKLPKPE